MNMKVPGFAENGYSIGLSLNEGTDVLVLLRSHLCTAGGAEGGNLCLGELLFFDVLEKGDVLGITPRPSPLDVMDSKLVQFMSDPDLVLHEERDIFRLSPIAKGCIVQFN